MIAALVRSIQEWKRYNHSLNKLSRLGDRRPPISASAARISLVLPGTPPTNTNPIVTDINMTTPADPRGRFAFRSRPAPVAAPYPAA